MSSGTEAEAAARRARLRALLLVAVAATAAHGLCLGSIFYQDDYPHLINNVAFTSGRWYGALTRLLPSLTYYLTYKACGSDFWSPAFHLVNLVIHVGTALVVFLALREILAARACPGPHDGRLSATKATRAAKAKAKEAAARADSPPPAERTAFWAAMIFACHPLATEVTNYTRARDIEMVTLFSMLAAYFTARWVRRGRRWAAPALAAVVCASMSKEVGVVIASATVVATAAACLERPLGSLWRLRWWLLGGLAATVLLHVALYKLSSVKGIGSAWDLIAHADAGRHVMSQGRVFWGYVARMIVPVRLCSDHLVPWTSSARDPVAWVGLLGVAALASLVVILLARGRRRLGIFLGLALLPLLMRFPLVHMELMVEYRAYPAMPWAAALAATGLEAARRRRKGPTRKRAPAPRLHERLLSVEASAAALVCALVALSAARCVDWWSMERLMGSVLDQYPHHARAVVNLQEDAFRGRRFERTIALHPGLEQAYAGAADYSSTHPSRTHNTSMLTYWYAYGTALVARSQAHLGRTADGYRTVRALHAVLKGWRLEDDDQYQAFLVHARARVHIAAGRLYQARDDLERVMKLKPLYSHRELLGQVKHQIARMESLSPERAPR